LNANGTIELWGGRVIDVEAGTAFPDGVRVVIRRGKIEALPGLPGQPVDIRPDASIDLGGRFLIPGLFNTHCHARLVNPSLLLGPGDLVRIRGHKRAQVEASMKDCIERGVTVVRDALAENLQAVKNLRARIEKGEIPGPRLVLSVLVCPEGGAHAPRRSLYNDVLMTLFGMRPVPYESAASGIVVFPAGAGPQRVRDAVDRAVDERGAECIKFYDQREKKITYRPGAVVMDQGQLEAAADRARRRGLPCTMHHTTVEGFRKGVRAGVKSLVHLPFDEKLTADDVRLFMASGCGLEPTFSVAYGYARAVAGGPRLDESRMQRLENFRKRTYHALAETFWVPGLRPVFTAGMEEAFCGKVRMLGLLDVSHVYRYFAGMAVKGADNAMALVDGGAGPRMGCGTDAGAVSLPPSAVGLELELFDFFLNDEAGKTRFEPADLLRAATIGSARCMGLDRDFGSIEKGKMADLAVVDGSPLEDPGILGKPVAALFMGGRLVVNRCGLGPGVKAV
jgi:imidazolonepropionase-like amidohydrolase